MNDKRHWLFFFNIYNVDYIILNYIAYYITYYTLPKVFTESDARDECRTASDKFSDSEIRSFAHAILLSLLLNPSSQRRSLCASLYTWRVCKWVKRENRMHAEWNSSSRTRHATKWVPIHEIHKYLPVLRPLPHPTHASSSRHGANIARGTRNFAKCSGKRKRESPPPRSNYESSMRPFPCMPLAFY